MMALAVPSLLRRHRSVYFLALWDSFGKGQSGIEERGRGGEERREKGREMASLLYSRLTTGRPQRDIKAVAPFVINFVWQIGITNPMLRTLRPHIYI
jgi:hypothetical protein